MTDAIATLATALSRLADEASKSWKKEGRLDDPEAVSEHWIQTRFLSRVDGSVPAPPECFPEIPPDLDSQVAAVLNGPIAKDALDAVGKRNEDPALAFYERFLAAHRPAERQRRGVFYTPAPIVNSMVRGVDQLLRTSLGIADGIAEKGSDAPLILDPAAGTGAFLTGMAAALSDRPERLASLLPRLYGIEIMPVAAQIARWRLGRLAREAGLNPVPMPQIMVGNAMADPPAVDLFGESQPDPLAAIRDLNFSVVIGNPPFSGHSQSRSAGMDALLRGRDMATGATAASYFHLEGAPLRERNPKWLNDDYVRFMRLAHHKIVQTGHGIVAFVTNNGYLTAPTFRGMRAALREDFDEIHVLDLHGSVKKRERLPDGRQDGNPFGIQQGVAIVWLVRHPGDHRRQGSIRHADLRGAADEKLAILELNGFEDLPWRPIDPIRPMQFFEPLAPGTVRRRPTRLWAMDEIFERSSVGIASGRDRLMYGRHRSLMEQRIADIGSGTITAGTLSKKFLRPRDRMQPEQIITAAGRKPILVPLLYRPFDVRWLWWAPELLERPRPWLTETMRLADNIGLLVTKGIETAQPWSHVFVSRHPVQLHSLSMKEGTYCFPLFLSRDDGGTVSNLSPGFKDDLSSICGDDLSDELVFDWIYGQLHDPLLRRDLEADWRRGFPAIPTPISRTDLDAVAAIGAKLRGLHAGYLNPTFIPQISEAGALEPARPDYDPLTQQLDLGNGSLLSPVPPSVWRHPLGGERPARKWLKDRLSGGAKAKPLASAETEHYRTVIGILGESRALMAALSRRTTR